MGWKTHGAECVSHAGDGSSCRFGANSLRALDSKPGFLRVFAGVVQARVSRGLRTSAGAENTGAATASQLRSANLTMLTVLNQDVYSTENCRIMFASN